MELTGLSKKVRQKNFSKEFDEKLKEELYADRHILKEIKDMWKTVKRDPKILAFKKRLKTSSDA